MAVTVTPARSRRSGWNHTTRTALRDYLASVMELLRLHDHDLTVDLREPVEELASVAVCAGHRRSVLYLHPDFLERAPAEQHETLLHELLHLHINPMVYSVTGALEAVLEPQAATALSQVMWDGAEYPVDTLAGVLASLTDPPQLTPDGS